MSYLELPPPPRRQSNKGSIGGKIAASRMTPEQRSARASIAGNATLRSYGLSYYSFLGKLGSRKKK
jgi:hypothetical protein